MVKLIFFLLISILNSAELLAQQYPSKLLVRPNNNLLQLKKVTRDANGDIVALGNRPGPAPPNGIASDFGHLTKLTAGGNKIWQTTVRMPDSSSCFFTDMILTSSGESWIAGGTFTVDSGTIIVANYDSAGTLLQAFQYFPLDTNVRIYATHIAPDSSNHLWIFSFYQRTNPNGSGIHLMKLDLNGNILVQKFYGNVRLVWNLSSAPAPGDGFFIYGSWGEFARFDSSGNYISGRTTGNNYQNSIAASYILPLPNGDHAVLGTIDFNMNYDVALMRVNSAGQQVFIKRYKIPGVEWPGNIIQTADGGFMFIASGGLSQDSAMLVKTDGNGNVQWVRKKNKTSILRWIEPLPGGLFCISGYAMQLGAKGLFSVIDTSQMSQCFTNIAAGDSSFSYTDSIITSIPAGNNILVAKQPLTFLEISDYTTIDDCFISGIESEAPADEMLHVFPNPSTQTVNITFNRHLKPGSRLFFSDCMGRLIKEDDFTGSQITLDISSFPQGIYFLHLYNGAETYRTRMVKQ